MITYQREYLSDDLIKESEALRLAHNAEVKAEREINPDWSRYKILEDHGSFVVYGARDDNMLVGYSCFVISPNFKNFNEIHAYQDSIYVKQSYRKKGVGMTLLRFTDRQLKKFGVKYISHMVLDIMDFSKVLKRMGYNSVGRIMMKEI
jgi:L-amino acid N-acyltransferase YncA